MKLTATITSVETTGDKLRIVADAIADGDADWRPTSKLLFEVSDIDRNRRAMHVGRTMRIDITVRP